MNGSQAKGRPTPRNVATTSRHGVVAASTASSSRGWIARRRPTACAIAAAASGEASAGRVAEAVVPHLASDSRHGAADFADPARVEALAGRIEGKISSGVGRTRKVRQDEAPTYINDRNRRMNLMLERHYGKFAAETKESFERGTAL